MITCDKGKIFLNFRHLFLYDKVKYRKYCLLNHFNSMVYRIFRTFIDYNNELNFNIALSLVS